MPLATGRILRHYEILGPLGAGGMGEVWRARDVRLAREVAIKVLPEELVRGGDHLPRFEREAQTLALLNHPNLAHVYGIDRVEDTCFIAMELVPGEDLEARLERGPLRLDEALDVCRQIAAGLEAAHDAGVVHRDLKPANVRLTPDGAVKVVDFGLARSLWAPEEARAIAFETQEGRLLGTPVYMAPEQLRGAPLDRRVDVWALGCVLYECLTGKRAFTGDTVSDIVAAVLGREADLEELPEATPARLRELIERCVRKDARRRLRDVGDARIELEEIIAGPALANPDSAAVLRTSRPLRALAVAAALILAVVAGGLAALLLADPAERPAFPVRLSMTLPGEIVLDAASGLAPPIAVSPDGRDIAFAAVDEEGVRRLYLRRADHPQVRAIPGTEGAEFPFFSPDGEMVAFAGFGGTNLYRIGLRRGTVEAIPFEYPGIRGVSWGADGFLVFGLFDHGLRTVPAEGGEATALTEPAADEDYHAWPQILPGGKNVLFTVGMHDGRCVPRIVSRESGAVWELDLVGAAARYVPDGFLVYVRSDELLAVRFDLDRFLPIGEPVTVRSGLHQSVHGTPYFAISDDGTLLVHEPARPQPAGRKLVWVDREGRESHLATGEGFEFPRLSPDGRKVAVAIHSESNTHEIWTIDVERGIGTNITTGGNDLEPVWTPGGDGLVFASSADGDLYRVGLSPGAGPERLLQREGQQLPLSFTPDGRFLFHEPTLEHRWDLMALDPEDSSVRRLVGGESNERSGSVSPDGRWLAYVSDETGSMEIYLCSYPDLGPKERITAGGGVEPVWSPLGGELFFRNGRGLYAVEIQGETGELRPRIGESRLLFEANYGAGFHERPNYDVSRDAERFVMVDESLGLTHGRLDVTLEFGREIGRHFAERNGR